jgi:hypothetical protein
MAKCRMQLSPSNRPWNVPWHHTDDTTPRLTALQHCESLALLRGARRFSIKLPEDDSAAVIQGVYRPLLHKTARVNIIVTIVVRLCQPAGYFRGGSFSERLNGSCAGRA